MTQLFESEFVLDIWWTFSRVKQNPVAQKPLCCLLIYAKYPNQTQPTHV